MGKKKSKTFIVKIQISQFSSDNIESVLIYDENRNNMYQTDEPKEVESIKELLKGRPKAYFVAQIVNTKYNIHQEAPEQQW